MFDHYAQHPMHIIQIFYLSFSFDFYLYQIAFLTRTSKNSLAHLPLITEHKLPDVFVATLWNCIPKLSIIIFLVSETQRNLIWKVECSLCCIAIRYHILQLQIQYSNIFPFQIYLNLQHPITQHSIIFHWVEFTFDIV